MRADLLLLLLFVVSVYSLQCSGFVSADVDYHSNEIRSTWSDFGTDAVLRFDWAVVTASKASGLNGAEGCRSFAGFGGYPDILGWKNVGKSLSAQHTIPEVDGDYFVIVRSTHSSGRQTFSNSGLVHFDSAEKQTVLAQNATPKQVSHTELKSVILKDVSSTSECAIEQEWACAAASVSVRQKLEEFYGPPRFDLIASFLPPVVVKGDDDDDDDDDNIGGIAIGWIILIGIIICACCYLVALFALCLGAASGKKGDEFRTNVRRHDNEEEF